MLRDHWVGEELRALLCARSRNIDSAHAQLSSRADAVILRVRLHRLNVGHREIKLLFPASSCLGVSTCLAILPFLRFLFNLRLRGWGRHPSTAQKEHCPGKAAAKWLLATLRRFSRADPRRNDQ
jgi:hypothetical protein